MTAEHQLQSPVAEPLEGKPPLSNRRAFLSRAVEASSGLLLLGTAGCRSEPRDQVAAGALEETRTSALPAGKDASSLMLHTADPLTVETKRMAFGSSGIVPYESLFVRNNLPMPDASFVEDRDAWELIVDGVNSPGTVTVGELKKLGLESVSAVLQCSGNGRGFFPHGASGTQWTVGAAGCVVWAGVPVHVVAAAFGGVGQDARFVTGTGGEVLPEGVEPNDLVVERSIPLQKGLQDALLAWEMNGAPIPLVHGGPLRLIVPGYFGVNQIKYIKRLNFTAEESLATIMRTGYRMRPIGVKGDPSQPTAWEMSVKSWINQPGADGPIDRGPVLIQGVAFGGTHPVRRVEVSTDDGRSWQEAPMTGLDMGRYAWRQFALPTTLQPGTYTLASRAADDAGNVQPERRLENERGYGNTSWRDHAVTITVH